MVHPLWPLFDLRLRTERLELRLPNDDEIAQLCEVARAGIHDPEEMPFAFPWTDKPSPRFEREFLLVQPQGMLFRFSRGRIRSVAVIAIFGKDRLDLIIQRDRRRSGRLSGGGSSARTSAP